MKNIALTLLIALIPVSLLAENHYHSIPEAVQASIISTYDTILSSESQRYFWTQTITVTTDSFTIDASTQVFQRNIYNINYAKTPYNISWVSMPAGWLVDLGQRDDGLVMVRSKIPTQ